MYKYFSGAGMVFLNTFQASQAPERYHIILFRRRRNIQIHFSGAEEAWEVFENTIPAPEAFMHTLPTPEKCLYILIWHVPEKPEKPEKYLYTPQELTGLASLQGCTTGLDIFYFRFLVRRLQKFG